MAWLGTDWQVYCITLLFLRYQNHDIQVVPDRHMGDLGLEAFSLDGVAYQCYAALEPLSTKELYEHQRRKLTDDTNKLRDNATEIAKLLGDLKISTYVYLVPRHDSHKLVQHAAVVSERVRSWGLSFIAADFRVVVETDDNYGTERQQLQRIPEQVVPAAHAPAAQVTDWSSTNDRLLGTVREKLRALGYVGEALEAAVQATALAFCTGENALDALRDKFPDYWSAASQTKSRREGRLPLEYPPGASTAVSVVPGIAAKLAEEIHIDAPPISPSLADQIAWGAVADWLMRCPLETRSDR